MQREDIGNWLLQTEDDFQHSIQRLADEELDDLLSHAVKFYEWLSNAGGPDLGRLEQRLRKLKQEQQRRAMSQVIPIARGAGISKFKLVRPPRLVYGPLLQCLLRPSGYKRYVEPHIADMHEEYFACLAKGNERCARWAVIRAHLYVIPTWAWALIARVIEWIRA